jgi:hypothetical protein
MSPVSKPLSVPAEYASCLDPQTWSGLGDASTSAKLDDTRTPVKFWHTQLAAVGDFKQGKQGVSVQQMCTVVSRLNTTSVGSLAAVAVRCRHADVRAEYLRVFYLVVCTLLMMVDLVRSKQVQRRTLGTFVYVPPIKALVTCPVVDTNLLKKRTQQLYAHGKWAVAASLKSSSPVTKKHTQVRSGATRTRSNNKRRKPSPANHSA